MADARVRERLARFAELLAAANRRTNLTAARDDASLLEHLLDSLTLLPYVRDPHVDVGSGGGFPAIVVAITANVRVTMVESSHKKARFLQEAIDALGLDARVVAQRAEIAAHEPALREAFASASARAVANAPATLELTVPFLRPGGAALLQRGTLDPAERTAAEDALLALGGGVPEVVELGGNRRLLVAVKERPTPDRFPRRPGLPEKRPLGTRHS